jgi:starch phosphorylase
MHSNKIVRSDPRITLEGYDALEELALNLRWAWDHSADEIWKQLDPRLWELTHNAWVVLQTVSQDKLAAILQDANFRQIVTKLMEEKKNDTECRKSCWFPRTHPQSPLKGVAYFSMEFMLSEALPIYSGGLGNVAGDQLKSANDLDVPVVAVGLLFQKGYFRQLIDRTGAQRAIYPFNEPTQLPIAPLRKANGEWIRLEIALPGWSVWLRVWEATVGRTKLYLLDTNDAANFPAHRGITSELYGGDIETRLKQELVLGIGGWRLLTTLGLDPEICHMNEGHSAFAIFERTLTFMQKTNQTFDVALAATRAGNLFTTHTAVSAGFDVFPPHLIRLYLQRYAEFRLGIPIDQLLALGRKNPDDPEEYFNMAYLAMRGSCFVNGVSRLHGSVSRRLFEPLFPNWPKTEIPVGFVTNGVHTPSWDSAASDELWTKACGKKRWLEDTELLGEKFSSVSDEEIWNMRNQDRAALVTYARARSASQLASQGVFEEEVKKAQHFFDPNALTLGFARRFASYKRPNLLLTDPDRLLLLLTNEERPVQLIIAGKAHPADQAGQDLIQQWTRFIRQAGMNVRITFLSDYDMLLTEHLVQGVDVWINTPKRPWEASGTSGMKILVNGGLNLSELDGWWAEAYSPDVGWAIGDGQEHPNDPSWDEQEAKDLYKLLEEQIVPEFYNRNGNGLPKAWVARIRASMTRLTPHFSTNRTVREYTEQYYLPAAANYRKRAANNGALAKQIIDWCQQLDEKWDRIHFKQSRIETTKEHHRLEVDIYLNQVNPEYVRAELYSEVQVYPMQLLKSPDISSGLHTYTVEIPSTQNLDYFTPRLIPHHPDAFIPLETAHILWKSK